MDELSVNRAFIQVVERGGFSAAARHLNTSVTSVARQIYNLEAMLGVRLLNRTTRRQSLTEAGHLYFDKINDLLEQIEVVKRDVSSFQEGEKGRLRVQLRHTIGNQVILPALPRFFARYPGITLDITFTDEQVDLVEHGVDVAVWLGVLEDSSMIARKLSPSKRVICGSPAYLQRQGRPEIPQDLLKHNCLVYESRDYSNIWRLTKSNETVEVPVRGSLTTNSGIALINSAIHGIGLALLQESIVREALGTGELQRVLGEYVGSPTDMDGAIYVVYPSSRGLSSKTRVFIDFLIDLFRQNE